MEEVAVSENKSRKWKAFLNKDVFVSEKKKSPCNYVLSTPTKSKGIHPLRREELRSVKENYLQRTIKGVEKT